MSSASIKSKATPTGGALPVRTRTLRSLLQHTPLAAFTRPEKGVLILKANVTAANAFKQLLARNVQSAPVVDGTDACIGFFELSDAVRYVVDAYDRAEAVAVIARAYDRDGAARDRAEPKTQATGSATAGVKPDAKTDGLAESASAAKGAVKGAVKGASAASASLSDAMDELFAETRSGATGVGTNATAGQLCRAHPFVALPESGTLLDAVALLCGNTHRVCVLDGRGAVVNVISQSDAVRFIHHNLSHVVVNELQRTVREWHMGTGVHALHVMSHSARAIDVFRRMCDRHTGTVLLTDDRGSYVDFAQPSDLKFFLSLFATPRSTDVIARAHSQSAVSSALFEAPIWTVLREVRELESQRRVVMGSGSAHEAMALSSICAPAFAEVVTRLATTRSHVLCLTARLDDSAHPHLPTAAAAATTGSASAGASASDGGSAHAVHVPVMVCSLGDVLRAVLRYVPPTAGEYFRLQRTHVARRAALAAAAARAAADAEAQAEADRAAAAAAAAGALKVADAKSAPLQAAAQPNSGSVAAAAARDALRVTALQLVSAAQGLSTALHNPSDREQRVDADVAAAAAALASVHSAYAALATASAAAAASAPPPPPQSVAPSNSAEPAVAPAAATLAAYNECTHDGVAHRYTDRGQCLHATHTCARLHATPPACAWPGGAKFCTFDLGYDAADQIAFEAFAAAHDRDQPQARAATSTTASAAR